LDYREALYSFVAKTQELRTFELTNLDWDTIKLVCEWLKHFRDATTQMSATKQCTLSSTHAIFKGLQDSLMENLRQLPSFAPPQLRRALTQAHEKLSDYFFKFDQSPHPIWASREWFLSILNKYLFYQVLDPRINYRRLLNDYKTEPDILSEIKVQKLKLLEYYAENYVGQAAQNKDMDASPAATASITSSPQKIDFISRYAEDPHDITRNELEEYFQLPAENYRTCDPIAWWGGRRSQFPNLCRLARDILCIPGI
jgi:hypothetical protein